MLVFQGFGILYVKIEGYALGPRFQVSAFRFQGSGFRVQVSGFRFQGSVFVQGSMFWLRVRMKGSGSFSSNFRF